MPNCQSSKHSHYRGPRYQPEYRANVRNLSYIHTIIRSYDYSIHPDTAHIGIYCESISPQSHTPIPSYHTVFFIQPRVPFNSFHLYTPKNSKNTATNVRIPDTFSLKLPIQTLYSFGSKNLSVPCCINHCPPRHHCSIHVPPLFSTPSACIAPAYVLSTPLRRIHCVPLSTPLCNTFAFRSQLSSSQLTKLNNQSS